jgi:hypothetical protein
MFSPFYRLKSFEQFTSIKNESDESDESDIYYRMIKNYNKKSKYSWNPITLNNNNILEFYSNLITFIYINF